MQTARSVNMPDHKRKFAISSVRHISSTGGPRYMREIGTLKVGWHIKILHIKRPRITLN